VGHALELDVSREARETRDLLAAVDTAHGSPDERCRCHWGHLPVLRALRPSDHEPLENRSEPGASPGRVQVPDHEAVAAGLDDLASGRRLEGPSPGASAGRS